MIEIRGREIRTSMIDDRIIQSGQLGINLKVGHTVQLICDNAILPSDSKRIYCSYKELPRLVKPNDIIYLDDGKIILLVNDCEMVRERRNLNYI